MAYDIGDKPVVTATFGDVEGGTGVASAVTFMVRSPSGVETVYASGVASEVTEEEDNVWVFAMPVLNRKGKWLVRAKATAGLVAAVEMTITVRQSGFSAP